MLVSKVVLDFGDESKQPQVSGAGMDCTLTIDGEAKYLHEKDHARAARKKAKSKGKRGPVERQDMITVTLEKIVVERLIDRGTQVSVPIMTYLPLREPEFERAKFTKFAEQLDGFRKTLKENK